MLDDQDLKKIGNLIEEKVGPLIDAKVGPIIDARIDAKVGPIIDDRIDAKVGPIIDDRIDAKVGPIIDAKLRASEERIIYTVGEMIEQNVLPLIANLPDKAYLDDKLADLEGGVIVRQRKGDQKANLLIEFLQKKQVLGAQEVRQLNEFQVFPSPPAVV